MKNGNIVSGVAGSILAAAAMAAGTPADGSGAINAGNVSEARVLAEAPNGNNWMVNGGDFGSQHFSPSGKLPTRHR